KPFYITKIGAWESIFWQREEKMTVKTVWEHNNDIKILLFKWLGVTDDGGIMPHVDAERGEGDVPFRVIVGIEHQFAAGGDDDPASSLDLRFQLARRPPGIAEHQHSLRRAAALRQRLQHSDTGGDGDAVFLDQAAFAGIIIAVDDEAAAGF